MEFQSLVNPVMQMQGILHDPISFITALVNTLHADNFYAESMIGVFGWVNYSYQPIVYSVYFLIFGYVIRELISYKEKILPKYAIIILSLVCLATFILPFLAMYLMWTPVGYSQILGVQGRYFLPLFPFVLLIIHQLFMNAGKRKLEMFLMCFIFFFISSQSMMTVYLRYYKEANRKDDLASDIKYDPTKIKYMPIDKQISFEFDMKGERKEITGFQFYFTAHNQKIETPYRYKLLDKSCDKTYREGDLDTNKLQGDSVYQENFSPLFVSEQKSCLVLKPVSSSTTDHYFSIIADEQSPRIELLTPAK